MLRNTVKYAGNARVARVTASRAGQLRSVSFFGNIEMAPQDPILSQTIKFNNDPKPLDYKINLGVGAYRDNNGKPWVLPSVAKAEQLVQSDPNLNHEYIPILGTANYIKLIQNFLFNQEGKMPFAKQLLDSNRIATGQGLSGTGSLKVLGEFLSKKVGTDKIGKVLLPNPSWSNHGAIFATSGLKVDKYRYYDPASQGLDLTGMLEDLNKLNPGDAVLLHVCCHNPTGVDPNNEQWDQILEVIEDRQILPIFDMAYQGFSNGIVEDLSVIEKISKLVIENGKIENALFSQSFAKNLGLYGERVGSFSIISGNEDEKLKIESQLKLIVRSMYSSPPCYGSKIVEKVLGEEELYNQWIDEVGVMRNRLKDMRMLLFNELKELKCHGPGKTGPTGWEHLIEQHGMFCFTGITPDQVDALQKQSIYMTKNGRISVAGVNSKNVDRLARSIAGVFAA